MIKHIVCFKLKDNSLAKCEEAKSILMSMQGKVEQIITIEVGIDFLHSPRSYDIILSVIVADDALDAYQSHPYHVESVKTYMHSVQTASIAVDFKL